MNICIYKCYVYNKYIDEDILLIQQEKQRFINCFYEILQSYNLLNESNHKQTNQKKTSEIEKEYIISSPYLLTKSNTQGLTIDDLTTTRELQNEEQSPNPSNNPIPTSSHSINPSNKSNKVTRNKIEYEGHSFIPTYDNGIYILEDLVSNDTIQDIHNADWIDVTMILSQDEIMTLINRKKAMQKLRSHSLGNLKHPPTIRTSTPYIDPKLSKLQFRTDQPHKWIGKRNIN